MNKENIYFIIPAYNEGTVIAGVLEELIACGYKKIVVVNDGSNDNTSETVKSFPVILIEHIINRGQGAALGSGITYALKNSDCKLIVTFDADGQHRLEDVERMISIIESEKCDIVIGSRFLSLRNDKLPFGRRIILKLASHFLRFIYGLKLTDAHNGLRVFRKECGNKLIPTMDRMVHASEMIYLIKKHSLIYRESPVKINYTKYSLSKGQKTSDFINLGLLTIYHKIILIFFEKD